MPKDPAFLFYPGDWLGGTMGMTFEEKGAYLELLVMQWNCHRITKEAATRVVGNQLWDKIAGKFSKDDGGFFNKRLEEEVVKRRQHSEKQKDNANKRWHKNSCDGNAKAMPLENENENWNSTKVNFKNDFRWKEKFCINKKIPQQTLEKLMVEFISDIELREEFKPLRELKNHFTNLYNKKNGSAVKPKFDEPQKTAPTPKYLNS